MVVKCLGVLGTQEVLNKSHYLLLINIIYGRSSAAITKIP